MILFITPPPPLESLVVIDGGACRCVKTVKEVVPVLLVFHEELHVLEHSLVHWHLVVVPGILSCTWHINIHISCITYMMKIFSLIGISFLQEGFANGITLSDDNLELFNHDKGT